ncbi:hypothetical protein [Aquimarina litoralis]|uniref:hypothetical protein n=1 Tax=Aquimarina litoralis TaxID=584605 RepID=UPI001C5A013E|nr:hypothetical protein [Aquimarina litoralis]MBW1298586.1 hypothetical protein [Aquimarina litoralis]
MKKIKQTIFQIAMLLGCMYSLHAQEQHTKITAPPFMASSTNFSISLFDATPESVKEILPEGMQPKTKENGFVTVGFELYTTARIYGMPKFSIAFIYVEVENCDAKNGTAGHWAVWGNTNNKEVLNNLVSNYKFPYEYSSGIYITSQEDNYSGTITGNEGERIHLKLKILKETTPFTAEGIVNMCGRKENGDTVLSEVTWFTNGQNAEVISLDITPANNKVLRLLKDLKPFWSMVSKEQTFCYSSPIILNNNP